MNQPREGKVYTIEIMGRNYQIRANDDKPYVENLARIVNGKLQEVEQATGTVDSLRLAILTSLNLADETLKLKAFYENQIQMMEIERQRLLTLVDEALEEAPLTPA